jgi:hypothetical protein
MLRFSKYAIMSAALLLSPAVSAQTNFSPVGTHSFSGTQKNLPLSSVCTVDLDLIVASGGTATVTNAVVSGSGIGCNYINFTGAPYPVYHAGAGTNTDLYVANFRVDIDPIPGVSGADACEGTLTVGLAADGTHSDLVFSTPRSDVADAAPNGNAGTTTNPCLITGTLHASSAVAAS